MTGRHEGAAPTAAPSAETARVPGEAAMVLTAAYQRTRLGAWLVPSGGERRATLEGWAALVLEDAATRGVVDATRDRHAVAVWLPGPPEPPTAWWAELAAATGRHSERFEAFHRALLSLAPPPERHHQLMHICVHPRHRGHGRATTLLGHRLRELDRQRLTAYAVATSPALVKWLTRHRFLAHGPPATPLDKGPVLRPMVREPNRHLHHRPDR
ncbi:GNAT family N-acetyltransferase [Micromonospora sp. CPCC 206061]|uniref:GNAT family N-acetyltransferase n=1 Tax=Micromonospora sp. CPCC 206061 TaxID=3122410 RepID=UPI002FF0667E